MIKKNTNKFSSKLDEKGLHIYKDNSEMFHTITIEEIEKIYETKIKEDMKEEIDIENIINYFEENYEGKLIDNSHINVFVFEIDKYYSKDSIFTEIKDIYYKYKTKTDDIRIRLEIKKYKKEIYMKFYLEGEDSIEPVCFGSENTEDIINEIHLFKQDIVTRLLLRVLYQTTKQTFAILSKTLHNHDLDKTEVINHLNIAKEITESLISQEA